MPFLNPAFLAGLGLVAIPLLIHLIRKRKLRVVQWAAMEFLLQSQRKQKRRLQIEEILLLLLRMLIVALAALAFARPVLRSLGIPLLSQNSRVYALIVLDNSSSMGFRGADGKSSFERAQASADALLTNVLKQGDAVSLILLSDKPDAVVGAPSYDLKLVRQRLKAAQVSDRGTDYLEAAKVVARLVKASKNPIREVYWLSDDQKPAWATSQKEAGKQAWTALATDTRITWISVGPPPAQRDNLSVEAPVVGRELVTPYLPARVESRIVNSSARARNDVLVNLTIDGKPAGSRRISISANGATTADFTPLIATPGIHVGRIALTETDGLAQDNAAEFVVRCRERIKVLVQDAHPTADPSRSESFYLLTAMAPGGEAGSLAPKLRENATFANLNLRDYDAVALTGAATLAPADSSALKEFVRAGGGLLLFPGPATDARRFNDAFRDLLPATLEARKSLSEENSQTLHPDSIPATHPALAVFRDTSTMNLASARFLTYFPLSPVADQSAKVILRFGNGDPALVERSVGLGKVILAASSAGTTWNQLPLKPIYVPYVYQLLSYLGQGATAHRNLRLDESLFLSLPLADANKAVKVTAPDGKAKAQNSTLGAQGVTFAYSDTARAGIYRVAVNNSKTIDAFAVGRPAEEGDLTYAEPVEAARAAGIPAGRFTVASTPAQMEASVNRSRYGTEVWRALIWAILPLLFIESLLAQIWGRRG
jgi:hypothetical protein